ncbi:MAG: NAD-dependent epimerase/dehydratase family protein [Frankia sp.]
MRVFVTGGSGFTGRRVVRQAVDAGHDVSALARTSDAARRLERLGAAPITGDLDDPASVDQAFEAAKADVLVNIASLGFGHADTVVAGAEAAEVDRAVFVSTTAIFTTLPAPSRAVRLAAERRITTSAAVGWTIVRPTMIYGAPGDRNMSRLLALLARTPVVPLPGGGDHLMQPVHVEDVATAILTAATADRAAGRCYTVAGPTALTLRRIVEEAADAIGRRVTCVGVPLAPVLTAARLVDRFAHHPRITSEQIARLAEDKAFDITPAVADLGFAPRPFAAGIRAHAALTR